MKRDRRGIVVLHFGHEAERIVFGRMETTS